MRVLRFAPLAVALLLLPACGSSLPRESAKSQLSFGTQMAQRGLWNEALFRFRQAEKIESGNPRVWNNLAVAYEATGGYEEALKSYRRALELAPADQQIKRNYSRFVEFYQSFKPKKEGESKKEGTTPPAKPDATEPKPPGESGR